MVLWCHAVPSHLACLTSRFFLKKSPRVRKLAVAVQWPRCGHINMALDEISQRQGMPQACRHVAAAVSSWLQVQAILICCGQLGVCGGERPGELLGQRVRAQSREDDISPLD